MSYKLLDDLKDVRQKYYATVKELVGDGVLIITDLHTATDKLPVYRVDGVPQHERPPDDLGHIDANTYPISLTKAITTYRTMILHPDFTLHFMASVKVATRRIRKELWVDGLYFNRPHLSLPGKPPKPPGWKPKVKLPPDEIVELYSASTGHTIVDFREYSAGERKIMTYDKDKKLLGVKEEPLTEPIVD